MLCASCLPKSAQCSTQPLLPFKLTPRWRKTSELGFDFGLHPRCSRATPCLVPEGPGDDRDGGPPPCKIYVQTMEPFLWASASMASHNAWPNGPYSLELCLALEGSSPSLWEWPLTLAHAQSCPQAGQGLSPLPAGPIPSITSL